MQKVCQPPVAALLVLQEMEKFQETGEHPELEAARQRAANAVPPLPEKSTLRPYVFFDLHINKSLAGTAASKYNFLTKCSRAARDRMCLEGGAHVTWRCAAGLGGWGCSPAAALCARQLVVPQDP